MHGQMYPTTTQCALFSKRKCHFDRLLQIIRDFTTFLFNGNDNGAQRASGKWCTNRIKKSLFLFSFTPYCVNQDASASRSSYSNDNFCSRRCNSICTRVPLSFRAQLISN